VIRKVFQAPPNDTTSVSPTFDKSQSSSTALVVVVVEAPKKKKDQPHSASVKSPPRVLAEMMEQLFSPFPDTFRDSRCE
jgi:hypothetical protein